LERIGNYEVYAELGSGTFGTVYRALGAVPGVSRRPRWVAIKVLRDANDRGAWDTLRNEFKLLQQVKHRSVCRVFELLEDPGAVVMEYVHGLTLRDIADACIERGWPIGVDVVAELGSELADCLYQTYFGHDEEGRPFHLVHRDIKPENILLTESGEVKVVDFGLARRDAVGRRRERGREGTPLYMSPEQARGEQLDHRTDLFSVGLVLYELLMNSPAYEVSGTDDDASIMRRIEEGDLGGAISALKSEHPSVAGVVERCLAPEYGGRLEDGRTLMLELQRVLSTSRGAALSKFCNTVFQDLYTLAELPPVAEGIGSAGGRASSAVNRRVETMSKKSPPRPGAPPRPGGGSKKKPARPSASGRKGSASRPPAGPKSSGGWSPPAAKASAPKKEPPKKKVKAESSARSPSEDGMLQMVSMDGNEDDHDLQKKKSATAFFSIPTPKRKAAETPDVPSSGPPVAASVAPVASPGMGSMAPGMASLPPGAMGGIGISGPVAGGAMGGGSSPFGVASQPPMEGAVEESRSQSFRVYFIILGLAGTLFAALVVAVIAIALSISFSGKDDASASSSSSSAMASKPTPKKQVKDTGVVAPPEITVAAKPPPRPRPSAPRPAAPRPKAGPQPISVTIGDATRYTGVEVQCPSGARLRGNFNGKTATVAGVPIEECTLNFKGGAPSKTTIRGGQSKTCTWVGAQANCR
jgi:serine/threonine protein kinase